MSHELQNIPFYWTALAHWATCVIYLIPYPKRFGRWKIILIDGVYLILLMAYMALTAPQNGGLFNVLMAGFALLTAAQIAVLCPVDLPQFLYYGVRLFMISGFTVSLAWQLYIYYKQQIPLFSLPVVEALFMLLVYGAVYGIMISLEHRQSKVNMELHISWPTCLSVLVIGVMLYILSSLSFSRFDTPFDASTYAEAFNIRTLVYFGGVALFCAVHMLLCEIHITSERDALENMLNAQYMSYQLGQESVELINRKYHDLKHQIAVLRSGIAAGEKLEYLDRLEREIQVYETQFKTGNQILDTILTSKSIHCQQNQIVLSCVADGSLLGFMEIADISVLFGNALDNAIEAVSSTADSEQRLIDLSVSAQKGFVWIRVINRFQGKVTIRNGFPVTTKADSKNHGYGVKSIAATAEKYGGTATVETKDGWFELRILIPMQQS